MNQLDVENIARRRRAFKALIPDSYAPAALVAEAQAPVNIALIKYWGKRDAYLNLPVTDSLSISLNLWTTTRIFQASTSQDRQDVVFLHGKKVLSTDPFYIKLVEFLSHVRPSPHFFFEIHTKNDVPTASGLASSASGFAACAKALNIFFGWHLSYEKISCLARLGSGSACRSLFSGICRWNKGEKETGEDSYAEPLQQYVIDTLMFGIVIVSSEEKEISSRVGMATTAETSLLFQMWPNVVEEHMKELLKLLDETPRNLHKFGAIVEHNAMTMHATAISASPSVLYWKEKSIATILKVYQLRKSDPSLFLYITMDAGPNLKLLFLQKDIAFVQSHFSGIKIVEPLWN